MLDHRSEENFNQPVNKCARCQENHISIIFRKFKNAVSDGNETIYSHYGICPTTKEPILLRFERVSKQG